ncbi:MAG: HU family DNA-binding protein [Syntrophobacteraceae bacterium]
MARPSRRQQGRRVITRTQSARVIDALFELIKQSLQNGEDVLISGFAKFSVREKPPRRGSNPQTVEREEMTGNDIVFRFLHPSHRKNSTISTWISGRAEIFS